MRRPNPPDRTEPGAATVAGGPPRRHRPARRRRAMAAGFAAAVGLVVGLTGWTVAAAQPTPPDTSPPGTTTTSTDLSSTTPLAATERTVTAMGSGQVEAVPDVVTIRLGAQTMAATAAGALAQNNERTTAVLDALHASGVEDRDLQTGDLSLYPTYGDEGMSITGYQASNLVTARLRDVGQAGATIDAAVRAAGDAARLEGVSFSVADDKSLLAEARRLAVEDARDKAGQLAGAAGVTLGTLRSISEASAGGGPPIALARDQAMGAVPLAPGTQQLRVDVVVVYDIG